MDDALIESRLIDLLGRITGLEYAVAALAINAGESAHERLINARAGVEAIITGDPASIELMLRARDQLDAVLYLVEQGSGPPVPPLA